MENITINDIITTAEAAEILGLEVSTVRKYLNKHIKYNPLDEFKDFRKAGGTWLIRRDKLYKIEKLLIKK